MVLRTTRLVERVVWDDLEFKIHFIAKRTSPRKAFYDTATTNDAVANPVPD